MNTLLNKLCEKQVPDFEVRSKVVVAIIASLIIVSCSKCICKFQLAIFLYSRY